MMLMFLLFLGFNQFVWKPKQTEQAKATKPDSTVAAEPVAAEEIPDSTVTASPAAANLQPQGSQQEYVTLSNDVMSVTFNTMGAVISQVELLKFKMPDKSDVRLIPANQSIAGLTMYSTAGRTALDKVLYGYQSDAPNSVKFYLVNGSDSVVTKTYTLDDKYGINLDVSIEKLQAINGISLSFESGIADTEKNLKAKNQDYKFSIFANNQLTKTTMKQLGKKPSGAVSSFAWAAIRSKYFTIAIMEKDPPLTKNYYAKHNAKTNSPAFVIDSRQSDAKSQWQQHYTIYAGPADFDTLESYGKQMQDIAERGAKWLRWLTAIFAWFLKFLHTYIQNYGIVIIIFSIIIKTLLHPFTHKQLDASLKMQKLQPMVQEIQAKYKSDPKRMQTELSKLYKDAGTSPFSSCLPLLLQMPIFFALYNVLRYSMDMRSAYFVGWLKDLSEPDPYLVLPIIMAIFMVLQQLLMRPTQQNVDQMDDKQKAAAQSQKMMMWTMPIVMFFVFKSMPAGLVLYWTVFNILSVVQQYYLQKHLSKKENQ